MAGKGRAECSSWRMRKHYRRPTPRRDCLALWTCDRGCPCRRIVLCAADPGLFLESNIRTDGEHTARRQPMRGVRPRAGSRQAPLVSIESLAYQTTSRFPVRRCPVILVGARFPVSILPRVITELRRVPQLLLGNIGSETTKRRIIGQSPQGMG